MIFLVTRENKESEKELKLFWILIFVSFCFVFFCLVLMAFHPNIHQHIHKHTHRIYLWHSIAFESSKYTSKSLSMVQRAFSVVCTGQQFTNKELIERGIFEHPPFPQYTVHAATDAAYVLPLNFQFSFLTFQSFSQMCVVKMCSQFSPMVVRSIEPCSTSIQRTQNRIHRAANVSNQMN